MMKHKSSKFVGARNKKKRTDTKGIALIFGVVLVLGAVYAWKAILAHDRETDEALCKVNHPVPLAEEWVIDCTEDCAHRELELVKEMMRSRAEEIPENARFTIRVIGEKEGQVDTKTLFDRCRPQHKAENSLVEAPRLVEKRYTEDYLEPLIAAVERIGSYRIAGSSPLLELFARRQIFARTREAQEKKLVFVSDGLQKSDKLDFYRHFAFPSSESLHIQEAHGSLSGASVVLYQRSIKVTGKARERFQTKKFKDFWKTFWQQYFEDICQAKSFEVLSL